MTSEDLTREQFEKLADQVRPIMREAHALNLRADKGLDPGDQLLETIRRAASAASALWVHFHYRSCGVGRNISQHLPPEQS